MEHVPLYGRIFRFRATVHPISDDSESEVIFLSNHSRSTDDYCCIEPRIRQGLNTLASLAPMSVREESLAAWRPNRRCKRERRAPPTAYLVYPRPIRVFHPSIIYHPSPLLAMAQTRRAHRKSRAGCKECKRRRIKASWRLSPHVHTAQPI